MSTYVIVTYFTNYTKVLNHILEIEKEYAKAGLFEGTNYKVEVSHRIFMDDYKVTIILYEVG